MFLTQRAEFFKKGSITQLKSPLSRNMRENVNILPIGRKALGFPKSSDFHLKRNLGTTGEEGRLKQRSLTAILWSLKSTEDEITYI